MSRSEGTGHALGSISGRLLKVGIAVDDVPGTGLSAFVLKVRFQEPQRLVEGPGLAVKMSAVVGSPSSLASSIAFRTMFATTAKRSISASR